MYKQPSGHKSFEEQEETGTSKKVEEKPIEISRQTLHKVNLAFEDVCTRNRQHVASLEIETEKARAKACNILEEQALF